VGLEAERARLQPGEPCPLCGSNTHPAVEQYQAVKLSETEKRLEEMKIQTEALQKKGVELRARYDSLQQQLQRQQQTIAHDEQQLAEHLQNWQRLTAPLAFDFGLQDTERLHDWLNDYEQQERDGQQRLTQHAQAALAVQQA